MFRKTNTQVFWSLSIEIVTFNPSFFYTFFPQLAASEAMIPSSRPPSVILTFNYHQRGKGNQTDVFQEARALWISLHPRCIHQSLCLQSPGGRKAGKWLVCSWGSGVTGRIRKEKSLSYSMNSFCLTCINLQRPAPESARIKQQRKDREGREVSSPDLVLKIGVYGPVLIWEHRRWYQFVFQS